MREHKEVFISFSSTENDEAIRIVDMLEKNGITCFISSRDLAPGVEYAGQLVDFIDEAMAVVLLLSKASNASPHVLREIEYAVSHRVPIIVYKMEEVTLSRSLEYFLMTHQWLRDGDNLDDQLVSSLKLLKERIDEADTDIAATNKEASNKEASNRDEKATDKNGKSLTRTSDTQDINEKSNSKTVTVKKSYILGAIAVILTLLVICMGLLVMALYFSNNRGPQVAQDEKTENQEISDENDSDKEYLDENEEDVQTQDEYRLGDVITLGEYHGQPIEWRVLKINDDGTMMCVSKYILTVKCFDSAEGGEYRVYDGVDYHTREFWDIEDEDLLVKTLGNNDWTVSNLRTWLNSDKELVEYKDQAPDRLSVTDDGNSYSNEPGFLYYFSDEDKAALVPTRIKIKANSFSENAENGYVYSEDLVYLLSESELDLFKEAGMPVYAEVTPEAIEYDGSNAIKSVQDSYDTSYFYWWLIDGTEDYIGKVRMVTTEYEAEGKNKTLCYEEVAASSYTGVRPVITLKIGD